MFGRRRSRVAKAQAAATQALETVVTMNAKHGRLYAALNTRIDLANGRITQLERQMRGMQAQIDRMTKENA